MKVDADIAIIGGGISGLSVAFGLVQNKDFAGSITVYEKSPTLGGNADTAVVVLGQDFREPGNPDFVRKADLGVNDINLTAYKRTKQAMEEIDYLNPDKDYLRKLEDTVCFFTLEGDEVWTKDSFLVDETQDDQLAVVDMRFSLENPENARLKKAEKLFMDLAAADFDPDHKAEKYWRYTTEEYIEYFRKEKTAPDWPYDDMLDQVVELFLLPRISAMYFADEIGARAMPFRGVMSYYRLQEGYGATGAGNNEEEADRRYFDQGSQHWIDQLAKWLEERDVKIYKNYAAKVMGDGNNGVLVYTNQDGTDGLARPDRFDKVVMSMHADHQLAAFSPGDDPLLTDAMQDNLAKIKYSDSISVAHTYPRVLPPNMGSWRTYNVLIRTGAGKYPYQMTYVQNRHRNDRSHGAFNQYGLPVYFVSLNPEIPIPDQFILPVTEKERERRLQARPGYADFKAMDRYIDKAVGFFRHTIMTEELLDVQEELPLHQGMADQRVYFAGCWAIGAGLHEECFMQAEKVVEAILTQQHEC